MYSYIDIPNWKSIQETIVSWLDHDNLTFKSTGYAVANLNSLYNFCPNVFESLEKMNFSVISMGLFSKTNYLFDRPHMDYSEVAARINIPVLNCNNVETQFYDFTGEHEIKLVKNSYELPYYFTKGDIKKIDTCIIDKPTVISVRNLHTVVVPKGNPLPRISATIRVHPDPVFYLEI